MLDKINSKTTLTGKLAPGGGSKHEFTSKYWQGLPVPKPREQNLFSSFLSQHEDAFIFLRPWRVKLKMPWKFLNPVSFRFLY